MDDIDKAIFFTVIAITSFISVTIGLFLIHGTVIAMFLAMIPTIASFLMVTYYVDESRIAKGLTKGLLSAKPFTTDDKE